MKRIHQKTGGFEMYLRISSFSIIAKQTNSQCLYNKQNGSFDLYEIVLDKVWISLYRLSNEFFCALTQMQRTVATYTRNFDVISFPD